MISIRDEGRTTVNEDYQEGRDTGQIDTHLSMAEYHLKAVRSIRGFEIEIERYAVEGTPDAHYITDEADDFLRAALGRISELRIRTNSRGKT